MLALAADGKLYAWGLNASLEHVRGAGIGALHSVARTSQGEVFAWGWSFEGSLGGGEGTINRWSYRVPIFVSFPSEP